MTLVSNKLALAVRLGLALAGAVLGTASFAQDAPTGSSSATAQNPPAAQGQPDAKQAQQLQTVTVTGSRIRSVDVETQQPVFVLSQEDIRKTGLTTVGDIVQRMTVVG